MKALILSMGAIISIVFAIGLLIAAGPMLPTIALVTLMVALVLMAGAGVLGLYWLYAVVDKQKAQAQAIRWEASKVHADNSAVIVGPGQLIQLTPGQLGYGSISQLRNLHISTSGQIAAANIPQVAGQLVEPARVAEVKPLSAAEALGLIKPNSLTWCFGTNEAGQPITRSIVDSMHVLNVASTGQGKTTLTANLIYQLVMANNPGTFSLLIADMKRTIGIPFAPWSLMSEYTAEGYLKVIKTGRKLVEQRIENQEFNSPLVLIVLEEALAIQDTMTRQEREEFNSNLKIVATLGREFNVFLLACYQVNYATQETQVVRGQFLTRFGGAVMPTAATSMGFIEKELVKRLWREKRPGRFLLEGPEGSQIINVPRLDLKGGELYKLLGHAIKAQGVTNDSYPYNDMPRHNSGVYTPSYESYGFYSGNQQARSGTASRVEFRYAGTAPGSGQAVAEPVQDDEVITVPYKELPPEPSLVEVFARCYRETGGIRAAATRMGLTYYQANKLYQAAKQFNLVD